MRILVCGGREFVDRVTIYDALDRAHRKTTITVLIHGAASGADTLAAEWAKCMSVLVEAYPADWKINGNMAGPIRNLRMLSNGRPDGVIAFPGGRGTANMVKIATDAGIKVWNVNSRP